MRRVPPNPGALRSPRRHDVLLRVDDLVAGYGTNEILHAVDLRLGAGQWLCLVGPNGAGKSTLLHSIFGLTDIRAGRVDIGGRNVTRLGPNAKLRDAGIACVLHDSSIFPDMTVEQNLWLGGYLRGGRAEARNASERVFDRFLPSRRLALISPIALLRRQRLRNLARS